MPAWSEPLSITLWPPASCAGTAPPEVVGSNLMNRMFECCAVHGCTEAQRLNRMFGMLRCTWMYKAQPALPESNPISRKQLMVELFFLAVVGILVHCAINGLRLALSGIYKEGKKTSTRNIFLADIEGSNIALYCFQGEERTAARQDRDAQ